MQLFDTAMIVDEPFLLPARIDPAALRAKFDAGTLPPMFVDLINAPARRQVDDSLAAAKSKSALLQRLDGLPEDEQHAVLLDLVRSHIATVLGNTTPEAIDPDKAFQELGFDSLTAVEMRNRLKAATGLALSPTLIFDYPNSAALAGYFRPNSCGDGPDRLAAVHRRGGDPTRCGVDSGQTPSAGRSSGPAARLATETGDVPATGPPTGDREGHRGHGPRGPGRGVQRR